MSTLSLSLFGRFQAVLAGEVLAGFRTNKVQALLIYLAVERSNPHRRESLMTLLWPGMPERSARHNLRQVLYHLRREIPEIFPKDRTGQATAVPLLLANRQTIQLNPQADVSVDVIQFESRLRGTQTHDHLDLLTCRACHKELATAVALYKGDFLADFYLDDSNAYEEWAESSRQAYRRQALDALETLTTVHTRQKAYLEARAFAEQQLEIDELRESGYRQLMEIMALNGQREEALAVYGSCRRRLIEELGMEPSTQTTALYEKIQAGDLRFDEPQAQGVRGYELKEEIGAGAFGAVHRAIQPGVSREVAVKVIRRKYANDPEFIRRFEAEAQTIARLEHPYIVPLYDYWRDPEGAYLVMRLLRGGNLLTSLESGPWGVEPTLKMIDQIASALAIAHRQGIVHRDIKPANVLFDEAGNAYLSDFGIAKDLTGDMRLTAVGAIMGTPDYISPEQLLNDPVTPQSDLYSLGAVLYESLTGEKPFPDASLAMLIQKQLNEPIPPVSASRPDLPRQIDAVIQQATAKEPSDRYPDALAMAEAFRQAMRGNGRQATAVTTAVPADVDIINPYKGLRAFQEADAADFFGRENLVEQLVTRLAENRFLAVVGPSGSGKSSAVKAGLIPALRQGAIPGSEKWFVAEMVPGSYPLEALELALLPIAVDPPPSLLEPLQKDERGLLRTVRRVLPDEEGAQLLLVIDQFEELFTLVDDEDRRVHFLDSLLAALSAPRTPLRVVVTLRADFYDRPLQYQPIGELFKQHTEIILPLTQDEMTWAIQEPARRVGVGMEKGVMAAMAADMVDQLGALPLLQYALTELFDERQDHTMSLERYRAIGGVSGALAQRAEEAYANLDTPAQEGIRQLLLRLVTLGEGGSVGGASPDTRRRVRLSELEALSVNRKPLSENGTPLTEFGKYRILTFDRDPNTREPTVEIAHEALLREWPRLRDWLDESRDDLRMQRRLAAAAREWNQVNQDDGFLLRGSRLEQFASWASETDIALTQDEQGYLEASIIAREARQAEEEARLQRELETARQLVVTGIARAEEQTQSANQLKRRAVYLSGALFIAGVLAVAALLFGQQAQENERLAISRELAAAALNNLKVNPELSVLLALEGIAVADTMEAESALHQTLPAMHLLYTFDGHSDGPQALAMSPDGKWVATGGQDHTVKVWEIDSGHELLTLEFPAAAPKGLDFSPDGAHLVTTGFAMPSNVWQLAYDQDSNSITGTKITTLTGHSGPVIAAAFSPDGKLVATGGNDGIVRISEAMSGQEIHTLIVQEPQAAFSVIGPTGINAVAFSPDGLYLATAGTNRQVQIWDIDSGQEIIAFSDFKAAVFAVAYSRDGTQLAASSEDGTVRIWDISSGPTQSQLQTIMHGEKELMIVDFDSTGTRLATAGFDGTVTIWDTLSGQKQLELFGHKGHIHGLAFTPDGERIVSVSLDWTAKVWDTAPNKELLLLTPGGAPAFSPDGSRLLTGGFDNNARVWDAASGQELLTLSGHTDFVKTAVYNPEGTKIATAGNDGTAKIWDAATGVELLTLSGHSDWIWDIDFSPDGTRLATGGQDGIVNIWEVATGELLLSFTATDWAVFGLDFSPDGAFLATGNWYKEEEDTVKVWNAVSGELRQKLLVADNLYDVTFSPDGSQLVATHQKGSITVWDFSSDGSEERFILNGHSSAVIRAVFSPDGTRLATGSNDGTAKVWDAKTGEEMLALAMSAPVTELAFTPDGKHLAAAVLPFFTQVFTLKIDELITLAQDRLTRSLTDEECQRFLHVEACPERP